MAAKVFANKREIACKAAKGKSICCFPDVCFTPPQAPPTPLGVPVPYPNTGLARDTTDGSRTVKISRKEVMLKNKSCFKKSIGDQGGRAPKKGFVNNQNEGKVYFTSWSMDVKIEGQNVDRHLDFTSHNHASDPPNALVTVYQSILDKTTWWECAYTKDQFEKTCEGARQHSYRTKKGKVGFRVKCTPECKEAQRCILIPKNRDKELCCGRDTKKDERTGDHIIEVNCFGYNRKPGPLKPHHPDLGGYNEYEAPTVCANAYQKPGNNHWTLQAIRDMLKTLYLFTNPRHNLTPNETNPQKMRFSYWNYEEARDTAARSLNLVFGCDEECTKLQLDAYHLEQAKIPPKAPLQTDFNVKHPNTKPRP